MSGKSTGILWAVIQQVIKSRGTITAAETETETETTFMQERTRELILYVDDMNPLIGGGGHGGG